MIQVIAFTQFIFFALGLMGLTIIVKAHGNAGEISPYSHLLVEYGLWLIVVPILWIIYARACLVVNKGLVSLKAAQISGVAIATLLFLIYAVAIVAPMTN